MGGPWAARTCWDASEAALRRWAHRRDLEQLQSGPAPGAPSQELDGGARIPKSRPVLGT